MEVYEDSVVDVTKFENDKNFKEKHIVIIYDDLMIEKHLHQKITQAYIKFAGGISMLFLSQSYHQIPKSLRLQYQYIIILKNNRRHERLKGDFEGSPTQ